MKPFTLLLLFISFLTNIFSQNTNPIVIGNARFTVIAPELIRMEYSINEKFIDAPTLFAFNRNSFSNEFEYVQDGRKCIIKTSRFKLQYINDGLPFSQMNIRITVFNSPENYEWRIYSNDDRNLGGTTPTLDEANGPVPVSDGLLSRNGWYLIDDSYKELLVNNWIQERPLEHLKDLYFFAYGNDYKSALKALTAISGKVPMTRKYVHGSWYCRWWDYTADEYRQIVKGYKEHDFPLDVMVMDMGWHTQKEATTGTGHAGTYGWTGYSWNTKLFPDPQALLNELKSDNLFVTLNDHPHDGIRHHEEQYVPFMKAMGADTAGKKELLFNDGDKKYMENFFTYALSPREKQGVDFWWLDWQQDYIYPHVMGYRNLNHLDWLNYLYYRHSQEGEKRGMHFSRWGGWGSHRYPIQFSGDANGSWEMLTYEVPFTAQSGNAGCFFWAHDIGGFYGERNPELYVRWTQFALTNSSLRIHSVYDKELDRRPWLWGNEEEKAMRIIYHMRSQLMPYIYSSVSQCHFQSLPLNRPMYIEYPGIDEAYNNPQEFLFGDLFLSAPITSPGSGDNKTAHQKVWFPAGEPWYNYFNHSKEEGGTTKEIKASLYEFPLFVKGGFPIPMQPYRQRMSTALLDTLVIRCYPGQNNKDYCYQLYEDDGISKEYEKEIFATTNIHQIKIDNKTIVTVEATKGTYKNQPVKRVYKIELPYVTKSKSVKVNGTKIKVYQLDNQGIFFYSNYLDIRKNIVFEVD